MHRRRHGRRRLVRGGLTGALDGFFDRTGEVRRPPFRRLAREAWSLLADRPLPPEPQPALGQGHGVLVIPAFLTNDLVTRALRRYLRRSGYQPYGWGLGVNWGPTPRAMTGLRTVLDRLRRREGGPVSLVGVSLGGLLARDLARERPQDVRHVITLASPLRLPTATALEPFFRLVAAFYATGLDPARVSAPLPVPTTAIFTKDDGIVPWQSCRSDEAGCISLEVTGPHLTLCRNAKVMRLVAERLARP